MGNDIYSNDRFIEKAINIRIQELEQALKDPNNGCAECRLIAKHTLALLKEKRHIDIEKMLGNGF